MLRILLGLMLGAHGIAHLVGFLVPWRLTTVSEVPYSTTILAGSVDIGPTGARVIGLMWLVVALAFLLVAGGVWLQAAWWYRAAFTAVIVSTALCVLGWPEARLGIPANVVLAGFLIAWPRFGSV